MENLPPESNAPEYDKYWSDDYITTHATVVALALDDAVKFMFEGDGTEVNTWAAYALQLAHLSAFNNVEPHDLIDELGLEVTCPTDMALVEVAETLIDMFDIE